MPFTAPPRTAAWRHLHARDGFEVVYFRPTPEGLHVEGCTTAYEDGQTWIVDYAVELDTAWLTRSAQISGRSSAGSRQVTLKADGAGHWWVDGSPAPHLEGCLDVDLESSAMTNTFPIHNLALRAGVRTPAPAAYVRAEDLTVSRLEQTYTRLPADPPHHRYDYTSPAFDFACRLTYDDHGLVLDYPGIATRTA
ncbi:putative glycolipid-binding domain-containing protein [Sphaerisporangium sp. TRM90804]|uniref:putative glycolipid-binding domain-containing protein n=1 Tax=Sphaerisporangium sp. TRM90804 TaxID=3031113 RepID=UPI002449E98D|nr:putative glycolipid-binding domain-containing protein [Sphaerisporangium sp. TRM90804]MDH2424281.1 putative glycolipid-binding domain-containing protein [Sphaerisporangium sp. TRM90804]